MTDEIDHRIRRVPGSGWLAAALTAFVGLGIVRHAVVEMELYGWMTFLGIPFGLGIVAVMFRGAGGPLKLRQALVAALVTIVILAGFMLGFALEGAICLAMAAPIWIIAALLGSLAGFVLHVAVRSAWQAWFVSAIVFALLPAGAVVESVVSGEPRVDSVTTSVVVNAPPQTVWRHVIEFDQLPSADEWIFQTGIAYPTRARIDGRGIGAVRRCEFSTGTFVEPITIWDEPRLLAFSVTENPPPMKEWSFYSDVDPPHLHGFLVSQRGQFKLTELEDGRTLLDGSTWYQHGMAPDPYWRLWSDWIVHKIHERVLEHIKSAAEGAEAELFSDGAALTDTP